MESIGFNQGVSNPGLYVHDELSLRCNVHGDDFTVVGSYDKLQWLIQKLKKAWTIEVRGILARPGSRLPNICHQISVLNRLISWTEHGIELEADPRHVELVLEQLGLTKAASVTTPLIKSKGDEEETIAMRIGYLSMDRLDMLRTVRELAKGLKSPTSFHWTLLKGAARYLKGVPRLVQLIPNQDSFSTIQAWSDTDHAGCVRTRKSTTGTVIQLGRSVIKATAKGQAVIALSSEKSRVLWSHLDGQCCAGRASNARRLEHFLPSLCQHGCYHGYLHRQPPRIGKSQAHCDMLPLGPGSCGSATHTTEKSEYGRHACRYHDETT